MKTFIPTTPRRSLNLAHTRKMLVVRFVLKLTHSEMTISTVYVNKGIYTFSKPFQLLHAIAMIVKSPIHVFGASV